MRLFWNNLLDAATTGLDGTEVAAFPLENIRNEQQSKRWRPAHGVATGTERTFTADLAAAAAVTAFLVLNHDLLVSDTIKLQANSSDAWVTPPYDQALTHSSGVISLTLSETYRYWHLSATLASEDDVRNIGRVFLGTYYDTLTPVEHTGFRRSRADQTISHRTPGGQLYTLSRPNPRRWTADLSGMTDADHLALKPILDFLGTHTAFFVQVDPTDVGELSEILYVKLARESEFRASGVGDGDNPAWDISLELEEAL